MTSRPYGKASSIIVGKTCRHGWIVRIILHCTPVCMIAIEPHVGAHPHVTIMKHEIGKISLAKEWSQLLDRTLYEFASLNLDFINTLVNGSPHITVTINISKCNIRSIRSKCHGIEFLYLTILAENELVGFLSCKQPYIVTKVANHLHGILL